MQIYSIRALFSLLEKLYKFLRAYHFVPPLIDWINHWSITELCAMPRRNSIMWPFASKSRSKSTIRASAIAIFSPFYGRRIIAHHQLVIGIATDLDFAQSFDEFPNRRMIESQDRILQFAIIGFRMIVCAIIIIQHSFVHIPHGDRKYWRTSVAAITNGSTYNNAK